MTIPFQKDIGVCRQILLMVFRVEIDATTSHIQTHTPTHIQTHTPTHIQTHTHTDAHTYRRTHVHRNTFARYAI